MSKKSVTLYCFSPLAMLATFVIEIIFAIYIFLRYKMTLIGRLVLAMLVFLAIFQLAEYNVCAKSETETLFWVRLGFISITILPPLALHLVHVLAKKKARILVWLAYGTGLALILILGLSTSAFNSHICGGNYVIFHLARPISTWYSVYYYSWLFIGIILSLLLIKQNSKQIRQVLFLQLIGYLSFLLPTGIVNAINPQTVSGIPSIMCGFAVIYAIILTFGIMPLSKEKTI